MRNPIKWLGHKIAEDIERHPIFYTCAALYIGGTLAVNAGLYGVSAGIEGIERLLGAETKTHRAKFVEGSTKEYILPGAHGHVRAGTFELEGGGSVEAYDNIVVTEGKFLPNMQGLQEGRDYNIELFGSDDLGFQFFVSAELVK